VTLALRYAARSDVGLVRSNNEDSVYAGARLLALADGMGGHAAGEVASQLVIAALAHLDDDEPGGDPLAKLDAAVRAGNSAIAAQVEMEPDLEGMGTTLTAILFAGNRIGMVHIGDSRGYLLRDGELTQITKDDTFVQTLVDDGRITKEEAHSHPQRSLIMRALTGHEVEPTLTMREVRIGDRYLLCSDGLSDPVSDETIQDAGRQDRQCWHLELKAANEAKAAIVKEPGKRRPAFEHVVHRLAGIVMGREPGPRGRHPVGQFRDQRRAQCLPHGKTLGSGLAVDLALDIEQRVDPAHRF